MSSQRIEALVTGGKATAGPPLGPALGPLGVNVKAVIDAINKETKDFAGMKVPVIVEVKPDKTFTVTVGTPPTSALVIKEAGLQKGGSSAGKEVAGNLTMEQVVKIAKMKRRDMLASTLKAAAKEVISSALSAGITIEGKSPKEVHKEIDEGKYDKYFKEG